MTSRAAPRPTWDLANATSSFASPIRRPCAWRRPSSGFAGAADPLPSGGALPERWAADGRHSPLPCRRAPESLGVLWQTGRRASPADWSAGIAERVAWARKGLALRRRATSLSTPWRWHTVCPYHACTWEWVRTGALPQGEKRSEELNRGSYLPLFHEERRPLGPGRGTWHEWT